MNEQNAPLISIMIPYYNDKAFLADAVESILNQTYQNFELILFNHASTDGSRNIARSYNDPRIIHIDASKNLGAGATYNLTLCLKQMTGSYFKTMCADDFLCPDCLENLVAYAEKNPGKDLIFGNLEYVDVCKKSLKKDWFSTVKGFSVFNSEIDLMKIFSRGSNILPYTGAFVRTEKLRQIKMDNSLTIRADMWLWLSLLVHGAKVGFCDKVIGSYRLNDQQESSFDLDIVFRRSEMEKQVFLSLFFEMNDLETVKAVFSDSRYTDKLTDLQDIPFYVAEYFLRHDGYSFAYFTLFKMLQNDEMLNRLEHVFDFGILELRRLYAFNRPISWKKKLYTKNPKKLNEAELFYLLVKRGLKTFVSVITLRPLRCKFLRGF